MEYPKILISGEFNLFKQGYNDCGIYGISGLAPSSFETPIYVGSSIDLEQRTRNHIREIKLNKHRNAPLQNYVHKNGLDNIIVYQLDSCVPTELLTFEQKYIDQYGTAKYAKSFNILPTAGSRLGTKHSENHKKKLSEAFSPERREQMSRDAKAFNATEEGQRLLAEKARKYALLHPKKPEKPKGIRGPRGPYIKKNRAKKVYKEIKIYHSKNGILRLEDGYVFVKTKQKFKTLNEAMQAKYLYKKSNRYMPVIEKVLETKTLP